MCEVLTLNFYGTVKATVTHSLVSNSAEWYEVCIAIETAIYIDQYFDFFLLQFLSCDRMFPIFNCFIVPPPTYLFYYHRLKPLPSPYNQEYIIKEKSVELLM